MKKIYFTEEQKFGSIRLYLSMGLIYSISLGFLLYSNIMQFMFDQPWGNKPMSDIGLVVMTVLVLLVLVISAVLLFESKLVTEINSEGIIYSFWPYFKKQKTIPSQMIKEFSIREYRPLVEYGGWGIKKGGKKYGDAINVSGNIGLQLILTDGKKILIGTQRPDAMKRAMNKMMDKI